MQKQSVIRLLSLILILLYGSASFGQFKKRSQTRAVIIGISDYEEEAIPDLKYSHKDAEAFAKYLQTSSGGSVPESNIKLLTEEDATCGNAHKALYWLLEHSGENDKAIIYFSGHGDVEAIFEDEPGHFLMYNTSASIYQLCSINLDHLKRIVRTLSTQKKSKVLLITDACRSGKLAGKDVQGSQATASSMLEQYGNETKIMSCQPNEFSYEGEQWGDGRGAFSYHLIDALKGMADANDDDLVDLGEVDNYIERKVSMEVKPQVQNPLTVGDKRLILSTSDKEVKKDYSEESSEELEDNESETSIAFYKALDKKYFLEHNHGQLSAEHLFSKLVDGTPSQNLLQGYRGDYVAALQDKVQHSINAYLNADDEELQARWKYDKSKYEDYPVLMETAANLLGKDHYLYSQMIAKKHYFECVNLRLEGEVKKESEYFIKAKEKIEKAMLYESRAAYIANELGLVLQHLNDPMCVKLFEQASAASPSWIMPYLNTSHWYLDNNVLSLAQMELDKAWELDSENFSASYIQALLHSRNGKYEEAERYLTRAIEKINYPHLHNDLGLIYLRDQKLDKALESFTTAIEMDSNYALAYNNIGWVNQQKGNSSDARKCYEKAISLDKKAKLPRHNLAYLLSSAPNNDVTAAVDQYLFILEKIDGHDVWAAYNLACIYALGGDTEKAVSYLQLSIKNGFDDVDHLKSDADLASIREEQVFLDLVGKLSKK